MSDLTSGPGSFGSHSFGRRSLLGFAAGLPVALVAGCGDRNADPGGNTRHGAERWSFTTRGNDRTVRLDAAPRTLVVDHYSAAAMWPYGIRPDGVFGYRFVGERAPEMDPAEARKMTVVGSDGELDLEALLEVAPDLIVGFGNQDGTAWTWWDEKVAKQVSRIAPFLGIQFAAGRPPAEVIEEYRVLAGKLGGDPDAPSVLRQRRTFVTRMRKLRELAERRPVLRFLPLNGVDEVWVGTPVLGQIAMLQDIGFRMVGPGSDDEAFTEISWEKVGDHPADVLMIYAGTERALRENPAYRQLPAVEAGQVVQWDDKRPYTYASYNDWLRDLIEVIERADRLG